MEYTGFRIKRSSEEAEVLGEYIYGILIMNCSLCAFFFSFFDVEQGIAILFAVSKHLSQLCVIVGHFMDFVKIPVAIRLLFA